MADVRLKRILYKRSQQTKKKTRHKRLKEDLVQLINQKQDLHGFLEEISEERLQNQKLRKVEGDGQSQLDEDKPEAFPTDDVKSLRRVFRSQAELSGIPVSVLSADKSATVLLELLTRNKKQIEETFLFYSEDHQEELDALLQTTKNLSHDASSFDKRHFLKMLTNKLMIPLELIWLLHKKSIVPFDLFISANLGSGAVYKGLVKALLRLVIGNFPSEKNEVSQLMLTDLPSILVAKGYSDGETVETVEKSIQEAYQLLLTAVFNGVYDHCQSEKETDCFFLQMSWLKGNVPDASFKMFSSVQLRRCLSHEPTWTVTDAFTKQGDWSSSKAGGLMMRLFRELSLEMELPQTLEVLKRVLEEEEVNWKVTLSYTSYLVITFGDLRLPFKELLDYFLQEAFESFEQEGLISAFLLARQAANEGVHVFMSYEHWFQSSFCRGNHPFFNSKKDVSFFLSFLTNLVPLESAQFLKVHVQHSQFIPAKYNALLDDYVSLAKTRLTDLGVPWDSSGIFKQRRSQLNGKDQTTNPAVADVNRAVDSFEKTGKIPSTVLQAIMFRRKYFNTYFLPTLLAPRMLPDIPDSKMKFILALNKANKIPTEKYLEYEQKCGEMLNELLEGAFSEEVMEEILEPLDALKADLRKLASSLRTGNNQDDLRRHLSAASDSLKELLSKREGEARESVVELERVVLDKHLTEIVDALLAGFAEASSAGNSAGGQRSPDCLNSFITMLSGHSAIHAALLKRLWMMQKDTSGSGHSGSYLGSLHAILHYHRDVFPKVKIDQLTGHHTLLEVASQQYPCSTASEMALNLKFHHEVVQGFLNLSEDNENSGLFENIPSSVVQKPCFLARRLQVCNEWRRAKFIEANEFSKILSLFNSKSFQSLLKAKGKPSIYQWTKWELLVDPCKDLLSDCERHNYYHLEMFREFLPELRNSSENVYWLAVEIIVNAIMDLNKEELSDVKSYQTEMRSTSQRDFIFLVSELLSMTLRQSSVNGDKVRLLCILEERLERLRLTDLDVEMMMSAAAVETGFFFSILLCLPPSFVISNYPLQSPDERLLCHLAKFLENDRQHLMEEPNILPFLVTAHIFKALLMLPDGLDLTLERLLDLSPALQISFVVYWHRLKPFIMKDSQRSKVMDDFDLFYQWTENPSSVVPSLATTVDQNLVQSSAIFAKLHQLSGILKMEFLESLHKQTDRQVFQTLAEFLISQTAWCLLHQTEDYDEHLTSLVTILQRRSRIFLPVFSAKSTLEEKALHPASVSLRPVVFFRILEKCKDSTWLNHLSSESFLKTALECHIDFRRLFVDSGLSSLESAKGLSQPSQLLSVNCLSSCNLSMQEVISKSSHGALQGLPDDLVQKCSSEVQSSLRRHMASAKM